MQPTSTDARPGVPVYVLNRPSLDRLRQAHGIESDADLARVIGVNAATLYRVSNGITIPSNEFMAKVAMAFPAAKFNQLFTLRVPESIAA
ncbi:helix-turn-helix domain-containing protein [Streptomyces sp. NPDC058650]|uniref:helix-turn-helix domain-containing protein n=1 Tax=Streptomyces sp. NPDC058650 TaxID=3346575 RepID=UPI0036559F45